MQWRGAAQAHATTQAQRLETDSADEDIEANAMEKSAEDEARARMHVYTFGPFARMRACTLERTRAHEDAHARVYACARVLARCMHVDARTPKGKPARRGKATSTREFRCTCTRLRSSLSPYLLRSPWILTQAHMCLINQSPREHTHSK
eukprot:4739909-Pleurochrysis_carterae.AAC.1